MKYCRHCGKEVREGIAFCPHCGLQVGEQRSENSNIPQNTNSYPNNNQFVNIPIVDYNPAFSYQPIGMWGYFGYNILFIIPVIGWIFILVYSLGGTRNINLRNYARSYFCVLILFVILFVFLIGSGGIMGLLFSL